MKNKEKYAKEIVEIACSGDALAVSKVTGKPISCTKTSCEHCNCYNDFLCEEKRLREWSEQWTGCCEDDYYGHYYWETEYPGKYLHMEFWL